MGFVFVSVCTDEINVQITKTVVTVFVALENETSAFIHFVVVTASRQVRFFGCVAYFSLFSSITHYTLMNDFSSHGVIIQ